MNNRQVIYGAGGHSRVVADAAIKQGSYNIVGFIDSNKPIGEAIYKNHKIIANLIDAIHLKQIAGYFIVAIGNNELRVKAFNELSAHIKPATIIHPSSIIEDTVEIASGSVILANSVINTGAKIGQNCIINSMVLIDHDSTIGNNTHLSQGTIIGSNVSVGNGYTSQLGEKINSFSKLS